MRQNVRVTDSGGTCRRPGWTKFLDRANYNNEDLHDQLLNLQEYYLDRNVPFSPQSDITIYPPSAQHCATTKQLRGTGRQAVTFLFSAISVSGDRKLLAGTQNRIYGFNEPKGNWKILSDAYGGDPDTLGISERRWMADQALDTVVFTNGFDPVLAWPFDGPTYGCSMQAVSEIPSLGEIGVTRAGVVFAWKGIMFLGDVEMDGERKQHRLVWSDFEKPTSFVPSNASVANFQDLPQGERILAGKALGDSCLIYTTKGIWEMQFVSGDQIFSFRSVYSEPEHGAACLFYRFTLASTGQEHIYAGRDGIYAFNLFLPQPDRVEWMHAASAEIFDTIEEQRCDSHTAWFDPSAKEYWISWVERGEAFPRRTLVFSTRYHSNDIVDHGFTAFCTSLPDQRPTLLQWMLDNLICLRSELPEVADIITPTVKEGGYCLEEPVIDCTSSQTLILRTDPDEPDEVPCGVTGSEDDPLLSATDEILTTETDNSLLAICQNRHLPIYTAKTKDLDGRLIEDYDAPADSESLCSYLETTGIDELCDECESPGLLIMASAVDWCLKQNGGAYYRERCVNCADCGEYVRDPYRSFIRSGALDGGWARENKNVRSLEVEFEAEQQAIPSALEIRIGHSAQAVDPNNGACGLVWRPLQPKDLKCISDRGGQQHLDAGTRPNKSLSWTFLFTGKYFYVEMAVDGINGAVCFSRLSLEMRQRPRSITSG